jgi:hypothetical protein
MPIMPRSTAYLEAEFHDRRGELLDELARERLTSERARIEAVLRFVRSHSPGHDAWLDDTVTPPVVCWTGYVHDANGALQSGTCIASNFREARQELGY